MRFFLFLPSWPGGDLGRGVLWRGLLQPQSAVEQCGGGPVLPQPHMQAGPAPPPCPLLLLSDVAELLFGVLRCSCSLYKAALPNKSLFSYRFDLSAGGSRGDQAALGGGELCAPASAPILAGSHPAPPHPRGASSRDQPRIVTSWRQN